jgi:phosphatidylserine/phosphatidylglycerophosphate/cardiolipin synthase-like enzyme
MSPVVTGRLVDEAGNPWSGLRAEAPIEYLLKPKRFRSAVTASNGRFTLEIPILTDLPELEPSFMLRAVDSVLRPVSEDKKVLPTSDPHDVGDVVVRKADRNGLPVTQLSGAAKFVSKGNALKVLIDGEEAFGRVVEELERVQTIAQGSTVQHRVDITQLYFDLPAEFKMKPSEEAPNLIFKFVPPQIVPSSPTVPRPGDKRPERLLFDLARGTKPVKVRVLLNKPVLGWPEAVLWMIGLPLIAGGVVGFVVGGLLGLLFGVGWALFVPFAVLAGVLTLFLELKGLDKLQGSRGSLVQAERYFKAAIAASAPAQPQIEIRGFEQPVPDHGVMHPKTVMVDGERAVVLGSPFGQRYFDDPRHTIEDPRRGGTRSPVVHDVSVAVIGPAVRHIDETFHLWWNEDAQTPTPQPATTPAAQTGGEDGVAEVQIVRTLSGQRFKSLAGRSEKGILEAYLRAFAAAKRFIFLETQYYTDRVINDALVEVLANTSVQVILMIPIEPDLPFYTSRQASLVAELRKAGGARVGVFTRWSYDPQAPRPWVAPVYLHTKSGVVDDSWATIGSANLDGLSLDYNLLLSPLVVGEMTASELNVLIFNGGDHPASPVVDLLRRRLWGEHLGLAPNDPDLGLDPLTLWNRQADAALLHVQQARQQPLPGFVLKYPAQDGGDLKTPRKHLKALDVDVKKVRPIGKLRGFNFGTQQWDNKETEEDLEE